MAIKISDVSVGDWVQDMDGNYSKVEGIWQGRNFSYQVDLNRDGVIGTISSYNIRPIPITPEILEANGFVKNGGVYKWNDEEYDVFVCLKEFSHYVNVEEMDEQFATEGSRIEVSQLYVHLLQHALRLVGVDKEIVIMPNK